MHEGEGVKSDDGDDLNFCFWDNLFDASSGSSSHEACRDHGEGQAQVALAEQEFDKASRSAGMDLVVEDMPAGTSPKAMRAIFSQYCTITTISWQVHGCSQRILAGWGCSTWSRPNG